VNGVGVVSHILAVALDDAAGLVREIHQIRLGLRGLARR
jgi:hypothetical protein